MDPPLVLVPSTLPDHEARSIAGLLGDHARVAVLGEATGAKRQRLLEDAAVLLVFAWRLHEDELASLRRLRLIQSAWAGVDRVPVERVRAACPGVTVATTSGANAVQVAEHAVGLYLDCTRGITWRDRSMRSGGWPQRVAAKRVAGSRVAVLGYGEVGRHVVPIFEALGAEVVVGTRSGRTAGGRKTVDVAGSRRRLGGVDGVVLCLPLTSETRGLVDREFLAALPEDGVLVNVARGAIVVAEDLYDHLLGHPRFQAGLDVWWSYPKGTGAHLQELPFHALPNVVMTPHSAFQAPEARRDMVQAACRNIVRFLEDGTPRNVVSQD